ncbi:MAG TPA: hypothetical protein VNX18_02895 [Bryobacteraceae bacterium]|nr:hypothetical protein [Bryobacteraceae bacterium]
MTWTVFLRRMRVARGWLAMTVFGMSFQPVSSGDVLPRLPNRKDARIERLENFFRSHHCPAPFQTEEYLAAADAYQVDYRLLPAVSVRESTCGLHAKLNNWWGWDSAQTGFESVAQGIWFVNRQLALGRYYRGNTLQEKLGAYNPNPPYTGEILRLMHEIANDRSVLPQSDSGIDP